MRKGNNDAIFTTVVVAAACDNQARPAPNDGKVVLKNLSWFMPHVLLNIEEKLKLYETIEAKARLPVMYRMIQCDSIPVPQARSFTWWWSIKSSPEKPRFLIISFQIDKSGSQTTNPAIFDHCNLTNMFVMLNSRRYPKTDFKTNFTQHKFSRMYGDAAVFRTKFYHLEELKSRTKFTMISNPNITPADYKDLFPLFVFDMSKQSEKLKNFVTDIQIKAQISENIAANTEAYAVVISDKNLIFQSDGNKTRVELTLNINKNIFHHNMNDTISQDIKTNYDGCFERHHRINSFEHNINVKNHTRKVHVENVIEVEKKRDKRNLQRKTHLKSLEVINIETNKKKIFQV